MSDEFTGFPYHQSSDGDDHDLRLRMDTCSPAAQMFDPNSYLSFSEFFNGSYHDQNLFSAAEVVSVARGEVTPNSSISSASENEENPNNGKKEVVNNLRGDNESFEREEKKKKPDEKKQHQRQARYAFMTKSEVDHLEDGYRWRKYGQKAVKNNAYPRSYYRCTTQKCPVKKRVERSFEDPSVVVTTYEGQHNHHIPVALRGHVTSGLMFDPSEGPSRFSQELLLAQTMQQPRDHLYGGYGGDDQHVVDIGLPRQQVNQFPDYGLLQDIIPPVFPKQE